MHRLWTNFDSAVMAGQAGSRLSRRMNKAIQNCIFCACVRNLNEFYLYLNFFKLFLFALLTNLC